MSIPRLQEGRLLERIEELARIGRTASGGVSRPGFSAADLQARDWVASLARHDGLAVWTDAAGNMFVAAEEVAPGEQPLALIGSHLDSVPNGGRLDGSYGVLAAIEVVHALARSRTGLSVTPVAVAFANEEGALFPQAFWGSLALAGRGDLLPADPRDESGRSLRGPLRRAGGDLDAVPTAAWPSGAIAGYLELHIEQGPVLERAGAGIGVVTAITGRSVFSVTVTGAAGHAGTVPMRGRRDAMVAAARIVLAVHDLAASRGRCRVATTGRVDVEPGAANVIPGVARLTVDLRDEDPERLAQAESALLEEFTAIGAESGAVITAEATTRVRPVATDPGLRDSIAACADRLGLASLELPSGAGHDAQIIAQVAPVGMIFVPSRGGLSHVPEEDTAGADLVAGAQVLLRTVLRQWLARQDDPACVSPSIADRGAVNKVAR